MGRSTIVQASVLLAKSDAIAVLILRITTATGAGIAIIQCQIGLTTTIFQWHDERGSDPAVSTAGAPSATNEFSGDDSVADLDDLQHDTSFVQLDSDAGPQVGDANVPLVRPRGPGRPATSTKAHNIRRREQYALARASGSGAEVPLTRGVGRPRSSKNATAMRRNQLKDEHKVAESAMRDVVNKVPGAEAALTAALQTAVGRKAFPVLAKSYQEKSTAQAVVSAVAGALSELSQSRFQNTKTEASAAAVAAAPASRGQLVAAGANLGASASSSSCSSESGQTVKVGKPLPEATSQPASLPPVLGSERRGVRAGKSAGANNSAVKMPLVARTLRGASALQTWHEHLASARLRAQGLLPPERAGARRCGAAKRVGPEATERARGRSHDACPDAGADRGLLRREHQRVQWSRAQDAAAVMSRTELLKRFFALLPQLLRAKAAAHSELSPPREAIHRAAGQHAGCAARSGAKGLRRAA